METMPGTSGGTGQPYWFSCKKCHRRPGRYFGKHRGVILTGKKKAINDGIDLERMERDET
jgi:hypothetical protein